MLSPDDETLANLTPAGLEEWIRSAFHDVPVAARESIGFFMRRLIVCDALLVRLAEVPPYSFAEWVEIDAALKRETQGYRRDRLRAEQVRIGEQRARIAAPVREFITRHTALLKVIESEHLADAVVPRDQPATHVELVMRRGFLDFRKLTALRAINLCPVIGIECVEAARTMMLKVRTFAERGAEELLERLVPEGHRLRARQPAPEEPTPEKQSTEIFNLNGSLKETVRKILVALKTPASKHQVVADRAELSLDEVKSWSTTLQAHDLITQDDTRKKNWCLTPKGEALVRANE